LIGSIDQFNDDIYGGSGIAIDFIGHDRLY
jgi:hypothetical protein